MRTTKLTAPEGCVSVSMDGEEVQVADDGSVDVPNALVEQFMGVHGFKPFVQKEEPKKDVKNGEKPAKDTQPPKGGEKQPQNGGNKAPWDK